MFNESPNLSGFMFFFSILFWYKAEKRRIEKNQFGTVESIESRMEQ